MLTEEQANELNLQQHALEAAEIGYNQTQEQLAKYNTLLNTIKNNYSSYTPEQKDRIAAKMGDISAKYRELKDQSYKYSIAQYEAQQQIDYYNQLAAQQAPTNGGQRRRIITPTNDQLRLQQYLDAGYYIGDDGLVYSPSGVKVLSNGYNLNDRGEWVEAPIVIDEQPIEEATPINDVITPTNNIIVPSIVTSNQQPVNIPDNIQKIASIQPGTPSGNISKGKGIGVGGYLSNVANGFGTTYMNPSEIVYQSNSRLPGWNLGAKLGRGGTVVTIGAGGLRANAPVTSPTPSTFVYKPNSALRNYAGSTPKWADATNYGRSALQRSNVMVPFR